MMAMTLLVTCLTGSATANGAAEGSRNLDASGLTDGLTLRETAVCRALQSMPSDDCYERGRAVIRRELELVARQPAQQWKVQALCAFGVASWSSTEACTVWLATSPAVAQAHLIPQPNPPLILHWDPIARDPEWVFSLLQSTSALRSDQVEPVLTGLALKVRTQCPDLGPSLREALAWEARIADDDPCRAEALLSFVEIVDYDLVAPRVAERRLAPPARCER